MPEPRYTLRVTDPDGTVQETELTVGQVLNLGAGRAIAYFPRDEQILVDDDGGTIIKRESAVPKTPDA